VAPSNGLFITDGTSPNGVTKVESYCAKPVEPSRPHLIVRSEQATWRAYWRTQWNNYWNMSRTP
jgi:hypothetical protein